GPAWARSLPSPARILPLPRAARKRKGPRRRRSGRQGRVALGIVYYLTWGAEGSRARRGDVSPLLGGTTAGGVVPGPPEVGIHPPHSGPETAFPATHDRPIARAPHHRPWCQAPSYTWPPSPHKA